MKKRITALLLCLFMIITMLPVTPVFADVSSIPACDCSYSGDAGLEGHADGCTRKSYLRNTYIVENSAQEIYADWAELDTETREAVLTFLSWSDYTKYTELNQLVADFEEPSDAETTVTLNGVEVSEVVMPKYEKPILNAVSTLSGEVSYHWQILADRENELWVDIYGEDEGALTLSYSRVASLLDSNHQAWVRCVSTSDSQEAAGEAFCVTVQPPVAEENIAPADVSEQEQDVTVDMMRLSSSAGVVAIAAEEGTSYDVVPLAEGDEEIAIYNIYVQYLFQADNTVAANPYTSTVGATTILNTTIEYPEVQGYLPYVWSATENTYVRQDEYKFDNVQLTEDFNMTVYYMPDLVDYKVNIYHQRVYEDKYDFVETKTFQAYTGTVLDSYYDPEGDDYEGLFQLLYEKPAIAADGSTEVDIYYDRLYYLMTFDLDGGYGVNPIYARYGTEFELNTPQKPGNKFVGWDKLNSEGEGDGNVDSTPTRMEVGGGAYKAIWDPDDTANVTFVFWGENADNEEYSYIDSYYLELKTGIEVSYGEGGVATCGGHIHDEDCGYSCGLEEHIHTVEQCYELTCTEEPHNHEEEGCTLNCTHTHELDCYTLSNNNCTLKETNQPNYNLTHIGNGIYTYTTGWGGSQTHYYLNIGSKWYCAYINNNYNYNYNYDTTAIFYSCSHTHNDSCYTCGIAENNHVHSIDDKCYSLICDETTHTHSAACGYACGKDGHVHTDNCYSQTLGNIDTDLWTFVLSDSAIVKEDGSSVVNVYFDRTIFTLTFKERNNNTVATITEKWGTSISDEFQKAPFNSTYNGRAWECTEDSKYSYALQTLDIMPKFNATFSLYNKSSETLKTIYYYIQNPGTEVSENIWPTSTNNFTLLKEVDTYFNYATYNEEYHEMQGFKRYSANISEFNNNRKNFSNNKLDLYYLREHYLLEFNNGLEVVHEENPQYGQSLSEYQSYIPDAPDLYEPGTVKFAGWYLNPECTGAEYKLDEHTMPADNLLLYAKWEPIVHEVTIYRFRNDDGSFPDGDDILHKQIVVPHGGTVPEELGFVPETPQHGEYSFVGWFYIDKNGKEQAFVFETLPVLEDMEVYAKWSSRVLRPYTIRYLQADANGNIIGDVTDPTVWVADLTEGSGLAGTTKTFYALGGEDLYAQFQEGWFPTTTSHSFTLSIDGENTYDFVYIQKEAVPYTVHYYEVDKNGDYVLDENGEPVKIHESVTIKDNKKAIVTENFKYEAGYVPDAYQKTLVVSADEGAVNEIIFKYVKDDQHAYYKVSYYTQNLDGKTWTEYYTYEEIGDIDATYTAKEMNISGFAFDSTVEGTLTSAQLTDQGLHLKLYYTRNLYSYKVRYLEEGTGKVLLSEKIVREKMFGSTVSESAQSIGGYTCVSQSPQSCIIREEADNEDPKTNIITFYYKENQVTIQYKVVGADGSGTVSRPFEDVAVLNGTLAGAKAVAGSGYQFIGWYTDEECATLVSASWIEGTTYLHPQTNKAADAEYYAATYYAKFEKLLTVHYVAGANGTVSLSEETILESKSFAGSTATPEEGYKFVGWYDDAEYTNLVSSDVIFKPGNEQAGKTFYAKFEKIAGDLSITKKVVNNSTDDLTGDEFTFEVKVPDGVNGSYRVYIANTADNTADNTVIREDTVTVSNGSLAIQLEDGQTATIKELPVGTYNVTEKIFFGYYASLPVTGENIVIMDDAHKKVNCVNTYPVYTGTLEVSKKVEKAYTGDVIPNEDEFLFSIKLTPTEEAFKADRNYTYTVVKNGSNITVGSITKENVATPIEFKLKDGEYVRITGLPVGGYTITEAEKDGYTLKASTNAEGQIIAGWISEASFTNTYERHRGDLTITKTVDLEYDNDTWFGGETFDFTITGTTSLADGDYAISVDGTSQNVTVENGKVILSKSISIAAKDSPVALEIKDLPVGSYTITETEKEGYATTANGMEGDQTSVKVTAQTEPAKAEFVNQFMRTKGNLYVSKTISIVEGSGETIDPNAEFTFTVAMPQDADFNGQTYTGTLKDSTNKDTKVTFTVANGEFTFKLKHGESITIEDLPVGSYTVTEAPASGYASSFPIPDADGYVHEKVIVETNETTKLECVNTFPVYVGDLTILKTVTRESDLDTLPDDTFTFKVQLGAGFANKSYEAISGADSTTVNADENGLITVQLKNGESVCIKNLPEGECTVTENLPSGSENDYSTTYTVNSGQSVTSMTAPITIAAGQDQTAAFTNQYKRQRTELTITKTNAADEKQVFVYEVKNNETNEVITVTVVGNGSTTIHNVPFGNYIVTQKNDWSWRHGDEDISATVTLNSSNRESGGQITFADNPTNNSWLDGNSWLIRNRKKKGGT